MTTHAIKDVLLIGYGAVGAVYSFILKNNGRARVTVVARSNYEAVRANGMNLHSRKYGDHPGWRPDRLFPKISDALDRPYSYVVLATKAIPEIQTTPALLAPLLSPPYCDIHPQPTYVLFQNGLNVEVALYDALKKLKPQEEPRIISTAVWIGTGLTEKNTVEHNEFDRVSLGVYRPPSTSPVAENTPAEADLLAAFSDIIAHGGSETTIVHEIQRVKFAKNMWNGVLGASSALARHSLREFFRPPHLEPGYTGPQPEAPTMAADQIERQGASQKATVSIPHASEAIGAYSIPFLYDTLSEVYDLGTVLYPPSESGAVKGLDPDLVNRTLANTARLHARPDSTHLPSMLMDVQAGRPMEVEHVVGEVVRMGRRAGVSMPRMEALYALLLVMQNQFLRKQRGA
ncbi:ketopantoate reductase PanE/ApbA C terminal-domain-containing protein [Dichomitus squalens]|uniref:Ketopantoate reductase PanE/ApbA C terminal-domain-containing protein n=1 Tax=Dichomitus squalens TaxID=114155 RepID=A0A4V2K6R8_9APHY|nr:ketopantoate reductase PanE/ApbA C terminal-domain-containing protein [Dichomitus squalens]TBU53233.1 ketopantoate reductase PanE/ApbA C terminal-domain-containing protein [Dichomitus squalens]